MQLAKQHFVRVIIALLLNHLVALGSPHIKESDLWKHVVTIDRIAWQESDGVKNINKSVDELNYVRRIYLDITGKIPTYKQLTKYLNSKQVNKRSKLIGNLLNSSGYVTNFTNFWNDLLRNPYDDPTFHQHKEFTRYIERFLYENRTYDKIVYDLLTAEGTVQENQAIGLYMRDRNTDVMDTFNASVRAFLGTRLGCAQCHNHRFDKWTQKEFYEAASHMWGMQCGDSHGLGDIRVFRAHYNALEEDKRMKGKLSSYTAQVIKPSSAKIWFDEKEKLTYPFDYAYDNAKPNEVVEERNVFGYGDKNIEGKNRRETFAKWMTSKSNPMFARVMANRLWKRIMGVALMEPVDDWKESITIDNPNLFKALGEIFVSLDYDIKAFLSVIFNSEAYQFAFEVKNNFKAEEYKVQGAMLKRMSSAQLNDSLLTLRYGDLDAYVKINDQYFEFEQKLNRLAKNFIDEGFPLSEAFREKHGVNYGEHLDEKITDLMKVYIDKVRELENYYNIGLDGRIKGSKKSALAATLPKKAEREKVMSNKEMTMMEKMTAMKNDNRVIELANYKAGEFMAVFGSTDRSAPDTNVEMGATMKQILKMMNSNETQKVVSKNSFLMLELFKKEKFDERMNFLFYSIYGRAPSRKDKDIAKTYINNSENRKVWGNYTLALINSPEFYFIK